MLTRRTLVVALAGCVAACAGPAPAQDRATAPPLAPAPPTPGASPRPATIAPTIAAAPTRPAPTLQPTVAPATSTPSPRVNLDLRVWNGSAELQLDGRSVEPGPITVDAGPHQAAALVEDDVVAIVDTPAGGGVVDLVVPPALAGLAVIVENQADARPQTGLTQADVVYEALAEGGITRFLSIFLNGDAAVLGPVRSLRHYFAFLAADYAADVVHIGASPEGYAWRDAMHMGHLDETYGDPGIWRVRSRPAPHNAYTDTSADRGFLQQRGWQQNRGWGPLLFSEHAPLGEDAAQAVGIAFRPWAYRVDYAWDADQGRYLRTMDGVPHRDAATGEQIAPATVIVQFAAVDPIPNDPKQRLDVNLVGASGELVIFSGGTQRGGTWSKSAPRSASAWLDAAGDPLVIPPGPVWVELVPLDSPLSVA